MTMLKEQSSQQSGFIVVEQPLIPSVSSVSGDDLPDLGVVEGEVILRPYSPLWKTYFLAEKRLLEATLGDYIAEICHFGSTVIENILSKPILDLMVGLQSRQDLDTCARLIAPLGYTAYHGSVSLPDWRMFIKSHQNSAGKVVVTHHLHIIEYKSEFWVKRARFHAYLTSHPEIAELYEQLKVQLAQLYPHNREAYTRGKTGLIDAINEMAERADHHAGEPGAERISIKLPLISMH